MSQSCQSILELPLDILFLVFPYLDAPSFLSLTSTSKALHQAHIRFEASYWSDTTRSTFRVPNRPAVAADGKLWYNLYKRLRTQSRLYTWGQNTRGCLGYGVENGRISNSGVPQEMSTTGDIGIVADLQCGGWSTTLLNNKGHLYLTGVLNGQHVFEADPRLRRLTFPGVHNESEAYDPHMAIRQFSTGRMQVLAVSDSGRLWLWHDKKKTALRIKFLHHDLRDGFGLSLGSSDRGRVKYVVAGWHKNSALIAGVGIVIWGLIENVGPQMPPVDIDTMLINETSRVPNTSYTRPRRNGREANEETRVLGEQVGEVTSYVLLENFAVWVTDLHRVYCAKIFDNEDGAIDVPAALELLPLQQKSSEDKTPCVDDIYGTFRTFALLKSTGEVLVVEQWFLDGCWERAFATGSASGSLGDLPYWSKLQQNESADSVMRTIHFLPALQNAGVVQLAFGDYHFHALHSNGKITSYGRGPEMCGTLGLGPSSVVARESSPGTVPSVILRGHLQRFGLGRDAALVPHAYTKGREVWFQQEKYAWLNHLAALGTKLVNAQGEPIPFQFQDPNTIGEVSEWIEQKARGWDRREGVTDFDQDGLGAHFALSVAAAGWHSGALVLVNEELERKVRQSCIVDAIPTAASATEAAVKRNETDPTSTVSETTQEPSLMSAIRARASAWSRSYLGQPDQVAMGEQIDINRFPQPGKQYLWAYDRFPRIRLSDGTLSRGQDGDEPVDAWPEGRPEWDLTVTV